ncbi:MAG TPA: diguanylate cyclase [Clostridia bacterium]|nr:diguanylate cyclase [Clostridia bacterium]
MNVISLLSMAAALVYIHLGIIIIKIDRKSKLNRMFFCFCLAMTIWSFGYAFVYISTNSLTTQLWVKLSALGWCSYPAFLLATILYFTENHLVHSKKGMLLLFVPAVLFFALDVIFFWPEFTTPAIVVRFFYQWNFIYNTSYLAACVVLLIRSIRRSKKKMLLYQSRIVLVSIILPNVILYLMNAAEHFAGWTPVECGQLYPMVSIVALTYAIRRYGLFHYRKVMTDEIMSELMDLVIFLDSDHKIIKINKHAQRILEYSSEELIGKTADAVFPNQGIDELISLSRDKSLVVHYDELQCVKKGGGMIPVMAKLFLTVDPRLRQTTFVVLIGQDISQKKRLEIEIANHKETQKYITYLAYHDSLTGLPNRKRFVEKLCDMLETAEQNEEIFAVYYLDLDDFKQINDENGHEAGDELLRAAGKLISQNIGEKNLAARIGGDEFVLLITGLKTAGEAEKFAKKIRTMFEYSVDWKGKTLPIRISLGWSVYPNDAVKAQDLIHCADMRMYECKRDRKKNRV